MSTFLGRVGLQQRVLPVYRAQFFDHLAKHCENGMSVFAGNPRESEGITTTDNLHVASFTLANNVHILSGKNYLCWQRGIREWIENWDPDVLIVEANPRYVRTSRAVAWMHDRGRLVIGWGLGAPPLMGAFSSLRLSRRKRFIRMFDALIAYSEQGANEYHSLGFPSSNISVAYNAVSLPPSARPERIPFQEEARVLFVGRLQERKRVDLLIRACADSGCSPELSIIGDGPAKADLEALAGEVYPTAEFLGTLHGQAAAPYFENADLFVLPGTGGLAVQEAMSYALPVIVAEGDGTQNDLVSGNGWLISPGDLSALTEALRVALSDPERLVELGMRSYDLVVGKFNIDAMSRVFIQSMNAVSGVRS